MLGRPIGHSLSPTLHAAAYTALGLDWTYDAIDCGVDDLSRVLAERPDWAGFSCTMPLKHAALDIADTARPLAAAVGAANTLLPAPEGWIADNTDVAGVTGALTERGVVPRDVTILGAGGTAQAVLGALAQTDVPACTVLARDPARADALRATARRLDLEVTVALLVPDAAPLEAGLVVSTLPASAADALAYHRWTGEQAVLDVVYSPWPTALARAAAAGGAVVIGGASVLLHQAGVQVTAMTGRPAPLGAMRAALRGALPGCGV